jgi:hypothetical protein
MKDGEDTVEEKAYGKWDKKTEIDERRKKAMEDENCGAHRKGNQENGGGRKTKDKRKEEKERNEKERRTMRGRTKKREDAESEYKIRTTRESADRKRTRRIGGETKERG